MWIIALLLLVAGKTNGFQIPLWVMLRDGFEPSERQLKNEYSQKLNRFSIQNRSHNDSYRPIAS